MTVFCQKSELTNACFKPFVSPDFETRGIEKVEALLVIFAKMRKRLYSAVFYDFAFSSFKWLLAVFCTNKWKTSGWNSSILRQKLNIVAQNKWSDPDGALFVYFA